MPTLIRKLLDTLSNARLRRLIELRNLAPSRSRDEKAESLARSYRGDYAQLIEDAALEDLRTFADLGPRAAGLDFELNGIYQANRSQLEKVIAKVFSGDWRPKQPARFWPPPSPLRAARGRCMQTWSSAPQSSRTSWGSGSSRPIWNGR